MAIDLHSNCYGGEGKPLLLVLHGLLGSSRNWITAARDLCEDFEVHGLDLRNHGESPHASDMAYSVLAEDLEQWFRKHDKESAILLGHSFGGKTAMRFACTYPSRVESLIVADISPKRNEAPMPEIHALADLNLPYLRSRAEAEEILAETIPDMGMRRFLLTNLRVAEGGGLEWIINYESIRDNLDSIAGNSLDDGDCFDGPTCFIRGGASSYVDDDELPTMKRYFPKAQLETLEGAGHNVHVDDREGFVSKVRAFALR